MVGISGDILLWINHLHFVVSRTNPKNNLQKLVIKNGDAEAKGMVVHSERYTVSRNILSFKAGGRHTTVFVKPVITSVWLNLSFHFSLLFSFFICFFSSFQGIWRRFDYL
jgi:hypothetical protein